MITLHKIVHSGCTHICEKIIINTNYKKNIPTPPTPPLMRYASEGSRYKKRLPSDWRLLDGLKCPRCKSYNCGYKEDDRGDFEDHCFDCKKTWWVDGPDY